MDMADERLAPRLAVREIARESMRIYLRLVDAHFEHQRCERLAARATAKALRVTHYKGGSIANENTTYADLVVNSGTYNQFPGDGCAVWAAVNGGVATEVSMQYLP